MSGLLLFTMLVTTTAQELPKGQFPEGWTVRVDGAAPAGHGPAPASGPQRQGHHVRRDEAGMAHHHGPGGHHVRPAQQASGSYSVKSETFLFDPGTRREAYGILIGGRHLEGDQQAYTYFVIRRSGEFLIRRRTGATTTTVKDWTPAAVIRKYDDKPADKSSVQNVLEVRVAADTTAFLVNGTEVARVPSKDIDTDGVVGLRVNHALNIHVSSLEIVR